MSVPLHGSEGESVWCHGEQAAEALLITQTSAGEYVCVCICVDWLVYLKLIMWENLETFTALVTAEMPVMWMAPVQWFSGLQSLRCMVKLCLHKYCCLHTSRDTNPYTHIHT